MPSVAAHPAVRERALERAETQPWLGGMSVLASLAEHIPPPLVLPCLIHLYLHPGKWHLVLLITI